MSLVMNITTTTHKYVKNAHFNDHITRYICNYCAVIIFLESIYKILLQLIHIKNE